MKEWIKKHKMSLFVIVAAVVMLIGLSYAWLQITLRGEKELTLVSGTLRLVLDDSMGSGITMNSAIPVTDEEGISSSGYTFTLENTGTIDSDYEISMEDLPLSESQVRMQDKFIKYQLTKDGEEVFLGILNDRVLDSGRITTASKHTYTLKMWIDENATNEVMNTTFKGKLKIDAMQRVSKRGLVYEVLFNESNLGNGMINTSDAEQTFITGENPNNYIWYSGKLWRAISKDTADNTVKLVTQWNISAIPYNEAGNSAFQGSYMESWLNDTSVDGFLGNLREPEKFIKTDSIWNATQTAETTKPAKTTMITDKVGLLNTYEYTMSYNGTTADKGYLNNGLSWWALNSFNSTRITRINSNGTVGDDDPIYARGVKPAINLKNGIEIIAGDGTETNPYRIKGDNSKIISDQPLSTRYSGEYIRFGTGENSLYRIVSHENGGTKIVSAEPLKQNNSFLTKKFHTTSEIYYNPINENSEIAYWLNNNYLISSQISLVENTTWYMGIVGDGAYYKNAKYKDAINNILTSDTVNAKVGLLRLGEQLSGQTNRNNINSAYWLITPYSNNIVRRVYADGIAYGGVITEANGVRPSLNLKENIKITGGDGTKNNPFTISE